MSDAICEVNYDEKVIVQSQKNKRPFMGRILSLIWSCVSALGASYLLHTFVASLFMSAPSSPMTCAELDAVSVIFVHAASMSFSWLHEGQKAVIIGISQYHPVFLSVKQVSFISLLIISRERVIIPVIEGVDESLHYGPE